MRVTGNSKRGGGAQALDVRLGGGELQAAASGAGRTVPSPTGPVPRPLRTGVSQLVPEPLRRWDVAGSQNVEKHLKLELTV